jgi:hypothetical protein
MPNHSLDPTTRAVLDMARASDTGPLPDGRHLRLLRRFRERTLETTSAQAGMSLRRLYKIEVGQVIPSTIEIAR